MKLVAFILLFTSVLAQLKRGQFCNVDKDCAEGCCDRHRCAIVNDCGFRGELEQFYENRFCEADIDCDSRCCLHNSCQGEYNQCYALFDLPIIQGILIGIALAIAIFILAYICTPCAMPKIHRTDIIEEITPSESWNDSMEGPIYYEGDDPQAAAGGITIKETIQQVRQDDDFDDVVSRGYYDDRAN